MKRNIHHLGGNLLPSLRQHSAEAMLGVCFYLLFLYTDRVPDSTFEDLLPLFPLCFAGVHLLNKCLRGAQRPLYQLSFLLFVPLLFVPELARFTHSLSYGITLLISFLLLLMQTGPTDNVSFAKGCAQTLTHLALSFFIAHVLALVVLAIGQSVIYIFGLPEKEWFQYPYLFILFVVLPQLFGYLQQVESFQRMPRFVDIILSYILSPGILIYTGLLYLYFITIVIRWELPKGGIGYMVLVFVVLALAGKIAQPLHASHRFYDRFYARFSWLALPPLAIFWVGTAERILSYSFTTARVYLLAAGILITLYIFLLFFRRWGNYHRMLLISILGLSALTFLPGINARSIGNRAQEKRLQRYIAHLQAMDPTTQRLKADLQPIWEAHPTEMKELYESYRYLTDAYGAERMEERYGSCPYLGETGWKELYLPEAVRIDDGMHYEPIGTSALRDRMDKGVLMLYRTTANGEDTLLTCDLNRRLAPYAKELSADTPSLPSELFVLTDDRYTVILNSISVEKVGHAYRCRYVDIGAVLRREE